MQIWVLQLKPVECSANPCGYGYCNQNHIGCRAQDRLTINNRYTDREFKLKFSALLKDYDLKCAENSKK